MSGFLRVEPCGEPPTKNTCQVSLHFDWDTGQLYDMGRQLNLSDKRRRGIAKTEGLEKSKFKPLHTTVQRYAMFGGGAGKLGEMRIRRHGAHVA